MKCPFCAEEAKNEALVCPHCQREIAPFRPILSRLSEVDRSISELRLAIDTRPAQAASAVVEKAAIATASSIGLATLSCWITWHYPLAPELLTSIFDKPLNFLSVASPFFAALWFGWSFPRLRLTAYLLLGLVPGLAGFVAWFALHAINLPPYPDNWKSNLFVYMVSGPLWFLAGGTIGARINNRARLRQGVLDESSPGGGPTDGTSQEILVEVIKGVFAILVAAIPLFFKR
jgi:hypothetical protein